MGQRSQVADWRLVFIGQTAYIGKMSDTITIAVTRMNGLGNDFIIIDARARPLALTAEQVRALAARDNAVTRGCDQLLVIHPARQSGDAFMQIFNADGNEVEACGNGARAVAAFLHRADGSPERWPHLGLETLGGMLEGDKVQWNGHDIFCVILPTPNFDWQDIPLTQAQENTQAVELLTDLPPAFLVNVGNPHAVMFFDDGRGVDAMAAQYGFELENHALFRDGANINFACIREDRAIDIATWERGVGLTQACGTGACAAAIAAFHLELIESHNNEFIIKPPFARRHENLNNLLAEIVIDYGGSHIGLQGPVAFEFDAEVSL